MSHKHRVYDSDSHFSINAITRAIKNESSKKTTLIQGDHNSERFTFEVPRLVEGHDMSLCDKIEVHYINISSANKADTSADVYIVNDMQISPNAEDEDVVIFSWLISGNATKYAGSLSFMIRFICLEGSTITYLWNTAVSSDIFIGNGINNSEVLLATYTDVLEAWKAKNLELNIQKGEAVGSLHQTLEEGKFPLKPPGNSPTGTTQIPHPVTNEYYEISEEDIVSKHSAIFNGRSAAPGDYAFAVNMKNVASGNHSFASGNYTVAKGSNSFTGGSETAADGFAAFATGNRTWAKANHTFTSGNGTKALAQCSRAGGINTTASGDASAAEGHSTESSGLYSYSNGVGTKAKKRSQFSIGEYNADDANALFMVGNGTDDEHRSNAFSVQRDGSIKVGGKHITADMLGGGGIEGYEWSNTFDDSCIMAYVHLYNGAAMEGTLEGLCVRVPITYTDPSDSYYDYSYNKFGCDNAASYYPSMIEPNWMGTSMGTISLDYKTGAFKSATAVFWNTAEKNFFKQSWNTFVAISYLVKKKS